MWVKLLLQIQNLSIKMLCGQKKVAITLYYLKDQGSYGMKANTFGKSPLPQILREVVQAIIDILGPNYIKFPSSKR